MVEICVIYDKVRFEEKTLYERALRRGIKAQLADAKNITLNTETKNTRS